MEIITDLLDHLNYFYVFFLMLLESTVIPVPSELVVAPAAFRAAAGELDIWLVILLATLGADCGASINYAAGYYLGRPIIYRFANSRLGHLCLLNQHKVEKSEKYFYDHGMVATITGRLLPGIRHLISITITGRLLPGIRHLISIPAGLAKMHYWKFLLYTTIGAGAWNCILAALGWYLHSIVPKEQLHDKIMEYSEYIKLVLVALVLVAIIYFLAKRYLKKRKSA